jgi:hypothetical protein
MRFNHATPTLARAQEMPPKFSNGLLVPKRTLREIPADFCQTKVSTESGVKVLRARGHSWSLFGASWRPAAFGFLELGSWSFVVQTRRGSCVILCCFELGPFGVYFRNLVIWLLRRFVVLGLVGGGSFGGFSFVLAIRFVISGVSSLLVPPTLVESFRTVPCLLLIPVMSFLGFRDYNIVAL